LGGEQVDEKSKEKDTHQFGAEKKTRYPIIPAGKSVLGGQNA